MQIYRDHDHNSTAQCLQSFRSRLEPGLHQDPPANVDLAAFSRGFLKAFHKKKGEIKKGYVNHGDFGDFGDTLWRFWGYPLVN